MRQPTGGLDFTLLKIQFTSERRKTIRVVTRSWDAFSSVYQYLERVSLFSHSLSSEFLWFKFGSHSFSYVLTVHSIICVCMLFWLSSWNESGMELKLSGSYIAINCLSFWFVCVCVCEYQSLTQHYHLTVFVHHPPPQILNIKCFYQKLIHIYKYLIEYFCIVVPNKINF